mgnify:CR=1 FL=1
MHPLEISTERAGDADEEQGGRRRQDTVHGHVGVKHVGGVCLRTDHHDAHAHKSHNDEQKQRYAENPFCLPDLSFGAAFGKHHRQRYRQAVGGDHEEAGIQGVRMGIVSHTRIAHDMVHRDLEKKADHYEDILGSYLVKLSTHELSSGDSKESSKLLHVIGDFERISDHAVNVLESVEELREKGIEFSPAAREEMAVLCAATDEILALTETAFINNDIALAYDVEPLEQVIDNLKTLLRNNHIARLKEGSCTVETGFIWSDLITNFERVSDHCSNVAVGIIDVSEHTMNAHEVIKSLKAGNAHYSDKYEEYASKYSVVKLA